MNKRQRSISIKFVSVILITFIAVLTMINFKDWVNQAEAMRAMKHLGEMVLEYREKHGLVPPESYVDGIKERLEGRARIGDLIYRARWIDLGCGEDEILAYTERNYQSLFVKDGFIVLRFDGRVEWMGKKEFRSILARQQNPAEIEMESR